MTDELFFYGNYIQELQISAVEKLSTAKPDLSCTDLLPQKTEAGGIRQGTEEINFDKVELIFMSAIFKRNPT